MERASLSELEMFTRIIYIHIFGLFLGSGDYGEAMTLGGLKDFHRRRVQVLAESGPDLLAFETVPNKLEAQVILGFLLD